MMGEVVKLFLRCPVCQWAALHTGTVVTGWPPINGARIENLVEKRCDHKDKRKAMKPAAVDN